ncbi:DUF4177 domain-containing protein [Luteimonas sp. M1R5S18]|jgi:hypothetical protein|uniref:DUF4177 domain-containing protein n=1 Tax=Luteimonas rhizosphaericola TaxID=3042024 RepID=A0ABT6JEI8_9GAMM|nr:DUF4177 domain-containing protein [Luteimonas rhizosphaericola]MDH5829091.1 DUF4177 domain-containing protein [Luteimonas rhizosphaericola]
MSKRWQYKIVELKPAFLGLRASVIEEKLVQLGAQGWELVSVTPNGVAVRLYLKKEQ